MRLRTGLSHLINLTVIKTRFGKRIFVVITLYNEQAK